MSSLLKKILQDIEQLDPAEQLEVATRVMHQIKHHLAGTTQPRRSWTELEGVAPNLLKGQDATDYVRGLWDEWDERGHFERT